MPTTNVSMQHQTSAKTFSIIAAALGTIVEWYDFMLFVYLSPYFSSLFFPQENHNISLLLTFAIYAAGFLMAPLGSLFFGSMGDRLGRRPALVLAISLMALPMLITAILPTFASIGIGASLILVLCRLVQGFSIGGQYGGTMAYMIEKAKPHRRGVAASIATMTSGCGVFLSSLIVSILTSQLSAMQMNAWGWRIGYVIGFLLTVITFLMRIFMHESTAFTKLSQNKQQAQTPLRDLLKKQHKALLDAIILSSYANITYYVVASYLAVYLVSYSNIDNALSLKIITVFGLVFAFTAPFFGWLADKLGRKPLVFTSIILFVLCSYPAFLLLQFSDLSSLIKAFVLLGLPLMIIWGAYGVQAPELFPAQYRFSGTSISYNIGNSLCGGLTPFVATLLISLSGNTLAPLLLLIAPAVLMLFRYRHLPETCPTLVLAST